MLKPSGIELTYSEEEAELYVMAPAFFRGHLKCTEPPMHEAQSK